MFLKNFNTERAFSYNMAIMYRNRQLIKRINFLDSYNERVRKLILLIDSISCGCG